MSPQIFDVPSPQQTHASSCPTSAGPPRHVGDRYDILEAVKEHVFSPDNLP